MGLSYWVGWVRHVSLCTAWVEGGMAAKMPNAKGVVSAHNSFGRVDAGVRTAPQTSALRLVLCACPWSEEEALRVVSFSLILASRLAFGCVLYAPLFAVRCVCRCAAVLRWSSGIADGSGLCVSGCFPLTNSLRFTERPTAVGTISPLTQLTRALPLHGFLNATTFALDPCALHLQHQIVPPENIRW